MVARRIIGVVLAACTLAACNGTTDHATSRPRPTTTAASSTTTTTIDPQIVQLQAAQQEWTTLYQDVHSYDLNAGTILDAGEGRHQLEALTVECNAAAGRFASDLAQIPQSDRVVNLVNTLCGEIDSASKAIDSLIMVPLEGTVLEFGLTTFNPQITQYLHTWLGEG